MTTQLVKVLDRMEHAATPFINDALYLYLGAVGAFQREGLRLALIDEQNQVKEVLIGGDEDEQPVGDQS